MVLLGPDVLGALASRSRAIGCRSFGLTCRMKMGSSQTVQKSIALLTLERVGRLRTSL